MSNQPIESNDMPAEIDLSKGARGLHHIPPGAKVRTTFSEFPMEGFALADPRGVHRRRLLVDGPRPTGWGNILGISGQLPRRAVSDFLLQ